MWVNLTNSSKILKAAGPVVHRPTLALLMSVSSQLQVRSKLTQNPSAINTCFNSSSPTICYSHASLPELHCIMFFLLWAHFLSCNGGLYCAAAEMALRGTERGTAGLSSLHSIRIHRNLQLALPTWNTANTTQSISSPFLLWDNCIPDFFCCCFWKLSCVVAVFAKPHTTKIASYCNSTPTLVQWNLYENLHLHPKT